FTTRADTLFGVTYVVLAPEHNLVQNLKSQIQNWDEVEKYLKEVEKKSDLDRQQNKEKTGVRLQGVTAINPATKQEIPIFIADYVLAHFGTSAVMAVPAHDERDCEFALKYDLPFKFVVLPSAGEIGNSRQLVTSGENAFILAASSTEADGQDSINAEWNAMYDLLGELGDKYLPGGKRFCCTFEGKLIQSLGFNAQASDDARTGITKHVGGILKKTYRLRDWGISRQRYWGCPIPMVYDPQGNPHIVPDEHLPWILPDDVDHTPDGTAPLARSAELQKRTTEIFGEGWTPEVDTMDTFVDSSWYFYRYLDNKNEDQFASDDVLKNWMPVDMYFGGAEHTTMHLLYSRFWVKALHKIGLVPKNEPYKARLNRGLILGPDGAKMSKSKGNVIDPDEVVKHVGADAVRMYLAFIGPFNEPGNYPWDPNGVVGVRRFIERVWRLSEKVSDQKTPPDLEKLVHKTIKKVTEDVDRLKLNTAISSMMVLVNNAEKSASIARGDYESLVKMIAAFAPHAAEEIWQEILGNKKSIHITNWPTYDAALCVDDEITLGIQINGKVRSEITIPADADSDTVQNLVLKIDEVIKW
ncbi:MAG: class I tRNA ligase family protein, partial [Minisyncoccia bacterium]